MLSLGLCAQLACIWEVTARKPGNVHRYRDFEDLCHVDFLHSAAAIAPVMAMASTQTVGETILAAVRATRQVVSTNTNLGIILLLAPLAAVPRAVPLKVGVTRILNELTCADARTAYEAIRLAAPGAMGNSSQQDLSEQPTLTLREVMALAADRDLIARQYANGFQEVLDEGAPALLTRLEQGAPLEEAIIYCHLRLMAAYPDSLIGRKRGQAEAGESSRRARQVLDLDWPNSENAWGKLAELDTWLRAVGHERNPGTTADLVTACLFVLLREGRIALPTRTFWLAGRNHA
jgi:triphosphoribosyl-dephospho-CoA synthase